MRVFLLRKMPLALLLRRAESQELHRHMGVCSLTLMGVGGTVGAGIFVLTGTAAAQYAGPAIAISFLLAGLACLFAGLCYAELASAIPVAGSAYTYAYASLGELVAWIIGWNLVLEYLCSAAAVAIGWSVYFTTLLQEFGIAIPFSVRLPALTLHLHGTWHVGFSVNVLAALVILLVSWALSLGVRKSTSLNAAVVTLKISIVLAVIVFGAQFVHLENWVPFIPPNRGAFGEFGWSGVARGAGIAFFAYIGFDMLSSSAQEARQPARTVPLSLFLTLMICTVLYVGMSMVLTGITPYRELNVANPVFVALKYAGPRLAWLRPLVSLGIVVGLFAGIFLTLYGQTRIFYSMSKDGLIHPVFCRVHPKTKNPAVATWLVGLAAALVASTLPLQVIGELVSIGTLLAFSIVCVGLLVLRRAAPDLHRPFRTPCAVAVATLGIGTCFYLIVSLPPATCVRFLVWLLVGLFVYLFYGRRHSRLATECPGRAHSGAEFPRSP